MNCSIAIIGMACEFPGAHTPGQLWENTLAGRRFFRKAPPERLSPEYFDPDPDAPGKSYCDLMSVITDWTFDPVEFRIPPVTFQTTDIAHWLALDTARRALRDSALKLDAIHRARVGVVLGNSLTGEFSRSHNLRFRWPYVERSLRRSLTRNRLPEADLEELIKAVRQEYESPLPEITEDTLAGNMANTIAGRICNYFDFGAGGFTVDGACSSSLLSVATACQALANGEMDFALAGGVDVSLDPFEMVGFAKTRALAVDDIRPYDERAAGMLTGEGCGIVVLARVEDARAAGYPIHALIRGWGFSSDGAGGLTAPRVEGQMRALRAAYDRAGYTIGTVGMIEGHGTGTSLGDRVELTALGQLIEEHPGDGVCRIGSIKANIGHCKAAAGIAGLIKAVLALERKILPATVNCERPNSLFTTQKGLLRPSLTGCAWAAGAAPRRASVSAMGFGGINAHIAMEEANPQTAPSPEDLSLLGSAQTSEVFFLAASSAEELRSQLGKLLPLARRLCRAELTDLSAALAKNPGSGRLRLALVADSPWHLTALLESCAEKMGQQAGMVGLDHPKGGVFAGVARQNPELVALFPGQGSQRLGMVEAWLRRFPFVRTLYDQVVQMGDDLPALGALNRCVFRDWVGETVETRQAWERELRDTRLAQPAIVLCSMAAWRVLQFFGLRPRLAIGHSLGEISALAASGLWDALTAVQLAAWRGEAMASLPLADAGGMAALAARPDEVEPLLQTADPALVISNYNSPRQTVVSGSSEAIQRLGRLCAQRGVSFRQLAVSHAFHSEKVAPAAESFCDALRRGNLLVPGSARPADAGQDEAEGGGVAVISTVTGQALHPLTSWTEHLAEQIRRPVRFMDAVLKAVESAPALWIEVGPGGVLSGLVRDVQGTLSVPCLPMDLPSEDSFLLLNQLLARAWVLGCPVRLDRLFAHRFHRALDVEHYRPQFIVNPCERAVGHSRPDAPASTPARAKKTLEALGHKQAASAGAGRDGLLACALEWIAQRTGFPLSAIRPEQRLRDDLNLDSIKVGELVLLLTREAGRKLDADPTTLANCCTAELVDAVIGQHPGEPAPAAGAASGRTEAGPLEGLGEWVRIFRVERVPAPLLERAQRPLPREGTCAIVGESRSPRATAIADRLSGFGLKPLLIDSSALLQTGPAPADLAVLVLLLPERTGSFLGCTPEEFDERVEGMGTTLFQVFRWAGHAAAGADLRGLVIRPAGGPDDPAEDLDAGGAFLKSLGLEYPEMQFKWLALPSEWSSERWAETAVQELQTPRNQVGFAYAADGQRTTEVACCLPVPDGAATPFLGPEDVVLVTGGGKGITCELALALAGLTKAKFALLGSSPPPGSSVGQRQRELSRNLKRFQRRGIAHVYRQADVTDFAAVREAVAAAQQALGPVTAVLHGAGATELRLFQEKELPRFLRCIRIKTRGLYNLLAAVPPGQLKALHVVSSVLGHTGMRGQADYALANAWLAGAVRHVKAAHPRLHCLSLGFTAWAETGLARKVGAVDSLRAMGVTALRSKEGTRAYLDLMRHPQVNSTVVITGRMPGQLGRHLFAPAKRPPGRFLEQIRCHVPGVELVAEATLAHDTDLYLPEHVFEGTPLFPGVMAIEAMVQAAMACTGRSDLPVVRNVRFRAPLIVAQNAHVVIRTLVLADPPRAGAVRAHVAIRSDQDGFNQSHFESECWFGFDGAGSMPSDLARPPVRKALGHPVPCSLPIPLPEPLDKDPDGFHPVPLFQGRFFRRIRAIYTLVEGKESLTEIQLPQGEQYFSGGFACPSVTPSPAVRDACLQSGALILPPGCLPSQIDELRFRSPHSRRCRRGQDEGPVAPEPEAAREVRPQATKVLCLTRVRTTLADEFVVDLAMFDAAGHRLETLHGLRLKRSGSSPAAKPVASALSPARLAGDLRALLPKRPHAVALVNHMEIETIGSLGTLRELPPVDIERAEHTASEARRLPALGQLVATRRAVALLLPVLTGPIPIPPSSPESGPQKPSGDASARPDDLSPHLVSLVRRTDGRPELKFAGKALARLFHGIGLALADSGGWSVAWLGPGPVGVDLEQVEKRDAETWRGLLGDEGYGLALRVASQTAEPFDRAATRVWTLLEAGKKANGLKRLLPGFDSSLGGPWLLFSTDSEHGHLEFLNVVLDLPRPSPATAALTLVTRASGPAPAVSLPSGRAEDGQALFRATLAAFRRNMRRFAVRCAQDPQAPASDSRHRQFVSYIERTSQKLERVGRAVEAAELAALRALFQEALLPFLDGSENFRHALTKPFGYPGDFRLLEMLASNMCSSRGLAWHFDRAQLDDPAAEACRQRIEWVSRELGQALTAREGRGLSILDLGVGAAPIEQRLMQRHPEAALHVHAVDFERAALERARAVLGNGRQLLEPCCLNLRDPAALSRVSELAAQVDVCIAVGLLEALPDAEATSLLATILRALPDQSVLYAENFLPTHPTRSIMEWFLGFHLSYRSLESLKTLASRAGADPGRTELKLDATGSLALLKVTK